MDTQNFAPGLNLADTAFIRLGLPPGNRALRVRALLTVDSGLIMRGHTLSIGMDRLVVSVPSIIAAGLEVSVFFAVTLDNETCSIVGTGTVRTCKPNAKGGFRAELDFSAEDMELLERVVSEKDRWGQ